MNRRRLSAFVDALAAGRRPRHFRADPEDVEVLRAAITLRSARPGESAPSEAFVEDLFQRLADEANPQTTSEVRSLTTHRARTALVAAAAAGILVGGTVVATETFHRPATTPAATAHIPQANEVRTATFQTADGGVLGQIVAYRGRPSWVFMKVNIPSYEGRVECMLQVADGTTVAFGTFNIHGGFGTFSKEIGGVNISELRGAQLVDSSGSAVAAATFA
jgi:hypothetical protein